MYGLVSSWLAGSTPVLNATDGLLVVLMRSIVLMRVVRLLTGAGDEEVHPVEV